MHAAGRWVIMIGKLLAVLLAFLSFVAGLLLLSGAFAVEISVAAVLLMGSVAFMGAVWSVAMRRGTLARLSTPRPEERRRVSVPGSDLPSAVGEFRSRSSGHTSPGERTVGGLYGAAVETLTRFRGLSDEQAEEQIRTGAWTDDPYAVALLSPEIALPEETRPYPRLRPLFDRFPSIGLTERVPWLGANESQYERAIRRTATAIAAVESEAVGREARASTTSIDRTEPDLFEPRTVDGYADGISAGERLETGYWHGIGLVALLALAVGLYAQSSAVVLAGVVGMGFATVSGLFEAPRPSIEIERSLAEERPEPGEEVEVTVTIRNATGSILPDLRFVDGVPGDLSVCEGSPRYGAAVGPEETLTITYTVTAERGRHRFDPALVITRDAFQSVEREWYVEAETVVTCQPSVDALRSDVPLRSIADTFGSTVETGDSGPGTAFHSVREYRHGDSLNRVDWNRHARTGELATREFHEERAPRVLLLVDARRAAYLAPDPGTPHAVDRAVTACGRLAGSLLEEGTPVGLAAIGPTTRDGQDADACWLVPGSGHDHLDLLQETLATHPQLSPAKPSVGTNWLHQLRGIERRLSGTTQVILLTPLSDDVAVELARRIEAYGHGVTVLSPDATTEEATSHQLARVARRIRWFDLQRAGIPVVNWPADERIDQTLSRTVAGDRR